MSGYVPPIGARSAARRGIQLVKNGRAGSGFESATLTRAHKIANGKPLTRDHVMRMHSFFARHAVDKKPGWSTPGKETPGYVAWEAWGGDAGASWSARLAEKLRNL